MNIFERFIEVVTRKPLYIFYHFLIGLGASLFFGGLFYIAGAGIFALWTGFSCGFCVGIGVEGYQIIHIKLLQKLPLSEWLQESIMDILTYTIGAALILSFMFLV